MPACEAGCVPVRPHFSGMRSVSRFRLRLTAAWLAERRSNGAKKEPSPPAPKAWWARLLVGVLETSSTNSSPILISLRSCSSRLSAADLSRGMMVPSIQSLPSRRLPQGLSSQTRPIATNQIISFGRSFLFRPKLMRSGHQLASAGAGGQLKKT